MPWVSILCSIDDTVIHEYGAFGGMRTGRGNLSIRGTPAFLPLCLPHLGLNIQMDFKLDLGIYTIFVWIRMRFGECYEHGNKLLGSIKAENL
jgi:hypothetical protein